MCVYTKSQLVSPHDVYYVCYKLSHLIYINYCIYFAIYIIPFSHLESIKFRLKLPGFESDFLIWSTYIRVEVR